MNVQPSQPQKDRTVSGDMSRLPWNRYRGELNLIGITLRQRLDHLKTKLVDYLWGILGVILWTLLITTIMWWLLAVVVWPAMDAPYNRQIITLSEYENNRLEVWSPSVVHGGGAPSEILFSLRQEHITNQPITVEVTIPSEFIIQASKNYLGGKVALVFTGQMEQESASIQLANASLSRTLGISQQKPEVQLIGVDKQTITTSIVPIGAEGTWRYIIRTLGGISPEKIPLFPFAALLVSIGGLWLRQNEEHRRQAEKRIEETRRRAENLFEAIRRALRSGDITAAKQGLNRMNQENLLNNIGESDWRKAERLLEFTQGKSSPDTSLDFSTPWLEETAGVLIYVAENNPFNRTKISALLRVMPLDGLKEETRHRLEVIKVAFGSNDPAVPATWPLHPPAQQELNDLPQKKGYKNPFHEGHTEDEVSLLFREEKPLFWSGHPLCDELVNVRATTIVIGDHGNGCTAFAMAVGGYYYRTEQPVPFTCYIRGAPSMIEMRFALANRLLRFLEENPHHLTLTGNEQKSLIAQILVSEVGKNLLLSRLEVASPTHQERWLENAEKDENKRKIWKAETQTHVNLLVEAIRHGDINPLIDNVWLMALIHCLHLLKFKDTIFMSIDAEDTFSWEWYHSILAPHQTSWNEHGLHPIIFTTPTAYNISITKPALMPSTKTLQWQAGDLRNMLEARWDAANPRIPLGEVLQNDAIEELLALAKGNPRRLIKIWREIIVKKGSPIPVDKEVVTKAVEDLSDDL